MRNIGEAVMKKDRKKAINHQVEEKTNRQTKTSRMDIIKQIQLHDNELHFVAIFYQKKFSAWYE